MTIIKKCQDSTKACTNKEENRVSQRGLQVQSQTYHPTSNNSIILSPSLCSVSHSNLKLCSIPIILTTTVLV